MQETKDTLSYMIAGYSVIYSVLTIYVLSLIVRFRKLRQEERLLVELGDEEE